LNCRDAVRKELEGGRKCVLDGMKIMKEMKRVKDRP